MRLIEKLTELEKDGGFIVYDEFLKSESSIRLYFKYNAEYLVVETVSNNITIVYVSNDITSEIESGIESGHVSLSII